MAGCPTHSRVSNVWDQESVKLLGLPLIPKAGMSGAPANTGFAANEKPCTGDVGHPPV